MSFRALPWALVAAVPVLGVSCPAGSALGQESRKYVVSLEAPAAVPLSAPLRELFRSGAMPSIFAGLPLREWASVGLRLRWGFLSNGPPPRDRSIKDPGYGGLTVLSAVARLRPSADHFGNSLLEGPWLDVGVGPTLTGSLVRVAGEAAIGWNMYLQGITFGPSVRYLHVVQFGNPRDSADAQLVLLGLEVALHDSRPWSFKPAGPATVPKVADRDGDGIPDWLDECPDVPEDKDGFEDEDGCPDPDNDKDGVPDTTDACPNEPETVNGYEDQDGCPDVVPAPAKPERVQVEERVFFDSNRSNVRPDGRPVLALVLRMWKQHPEWDRLVIDGHADRHGEDAFNIQLSRARAEEVRRQFVDMGVPPERLRIRVFGNRKPRMPGDEPEADRENRRVEFVFIRKNEDKVEGAAPAAQTEEVPAKTPPGGTTP